MMPDDIAYIQASYRDAKDKRRQVGILADMYQAKRQDIEELLGINVTPLKPDRRKADPEKVRAVIELRQQGVRIVDIAKKIGVSCTSVVAWSS